MFVRTYTYYIVHVLYNIVQHTILYYHSPAPSRCGQPLLHVGHAAPLLVVELEAGGLPLLYVYIYIYIERERETEMYTYVYIYNIYT